MTPEDALKLLNSYFPPDTGFWSGRSHGWGSVFGEGLGSGDGFGSGHSIGDGDGFGENTIDPTEYLERGSDDS